MADQLSFFQTMPPMGVRKAPTSEVIRRQIRDILDSEPDLAGSVGRVVVRVWRLFYGLEDVIAEGNVERIELFLAGELDYVPNYKSVSRRYHEVMKERQGNG